MKVRLIHDTSEGIITKVLPNKQIEVEIEDGFRIPVMQNEVVVVQAEESEFFGGQRKKKAESKPIVQPTKYSRMVTKEGTYIAFIPFNDEEVTLYLINYTDALLLYNFGKGVGSKYQGLRADLLPKNKAVRLDRLPIKSLKEWEPLVFQLMWHERARLHQPLQKVFQSFSPKTFFKDKKAAPVIHKEGVVFPVVADSKRATFKPNAQAMRETILENRAEDTMEEVASVPAEVDLHIEKLIDKHDDMSNHEIVMLQLNTFEKYLDQAVVGNREEITFIHGVGKGKLRKEIQKRLSGHPNVQYFKDAQRNKFGQYGATYVKLK
ncbi:MAG: Smr/MutS family protein [Bacteroidota bacterium]